MRYQLAKWLINQLPDLVNTTHPDQVLRIDSKSGRAFLGDRVVNELDKETLAKDAKRMANSKLWMVMMATLEADANERIVLKSTTWDDVWAGKMQLYNLSIMRKILRLAESFAKAEQ